MLIGDNKDEGILPSLYKLAFNFLTNSSSNNINSDDSNILNGVSLE